MLTASKSGPTRVSRDRDISYLVHNGKKIPITPGLLIEVDLDPDQWEAQNNCPAIERNRLTKYKFNFSGGQLMAARAGYTWKFVG